MTAARPLAQVAGEILERIAAAERLFCFLDYDGTLAPIAATPEAARPLPGMPEVLRALAVAPGTRVALVSGRSIENLSAHLDVAGVWYIGIHGLETRAPDGSYQRTEQAAVIRSLLPAIRRRLEVALSAHPGIALEDKGAALACHFRLASREAAAAARWTVSSVVREYTSRGLAIAAIEGHEVIEIRPAFVSKGKAVRALLNEQGRGVLPLYVGDDRTDEDAFAVLPAPAVTVRVGPPDTVTTARYLLADPVAVAEFLRDVLRVRGG
jgi:trehalose-phosphatase